jgi:large subunit ribosomal protein L22
VILNHQKIKTLAKEKGLSRDDLAEAVARDGFSAKAARSAVGNWLSGRNHPRAKFEDARRIASALDLEAKDVARFVSVARWQRSSPQKARLVADLIRGKRVDEAENLLAFSPRRAAKMVLKTLQTAIADAEQNDADVTQLYVSESRVDEGVTIKRFQPKDRGRAHPINKRTSHITIGVEEHA